MSQVLKNKSFTKMSKYSLQHFTAKLNALILPIVSKLTEICTFFDVNVYIYAL